jgi:hypothetical protein
MRPSACSVFEVPLRPAPEIGPPTAQSTPFEIGEDARIPGGVSPADLCAFLEDLIPRLTHLAHPGPR